MASLGPIALGGMLGAGGMLLGSRGGRKPPKLQKMPPVEDMLDIIDDISGVKAVTTIDQHGKKSRRITKLPRSPQEEAISQMLMDVISSVPREIQRLYREDPQAAVEFLPTIQAINEANRRRGADLARFMNIPDYQQLEREFKDMETNIVNQQYDNATVEATNRLAGNGYGVDSTAYANAQAALAAQKANSMRDVDIHSKLAAQQYADADARLRGLQYGLTEQGRQEEIGGQQALLGLNQQYASEREAQRRQRIAEQTNLMNMASALRGYDQSVLQNSQAPNMGNAIYNAQLGATQANNAAMMQQYAMQPQSISSALGNIAGNLGSRLMYRGLSKRFGLD